MSATQISVILPPPVVQSKRSYSSIWEAKYDFEDNATVPVSAMAQLKKYLSAEVDEGRSTVALAAYCFITGVMYVYHYEHVFPPLRSI